MAQLIRAPRRPQFTSLVPRPTKVPSTLASVLLIALASPAGNGTVVASPSRVSLVLSGRFRDGRRRPAQRPRPRAPRPQLLPLPTTAAGRRTRKTEWSPTASAI